MIKRAAKFVDAVFSDYGLLVLLMWLFEFSIESAALVFLALRVIDLAESRWGVKGSNHQEETKAHNKG